MKNLKLLSALLLICLLASLFALPTAALSDPAPEANAVMLIDMVTGNTLYAKNEEVQAAPASLTKIMTVMLAVEDIEIGKISQYDTVTASPNMTYDLIVDGSTAGIEVGESMSLEDLLYCAMVSSANEACNIIAEYVSGSISAFVSRMNARAQELGCTGTNFTNTHGLPSSNHYTTAKDVALISRAAMAHPLFAAICNTTSVTIAATNMSDARRLENTNGLINNNSEFYSGYFYEYAAGVKTGHTEAAGYCLVSTAKKNGIHLLCVVMGGKATAMTDGMRYGSFTDSINLYNWAFDNFSYRDILKVTAIVKDLPVLMGSEADFVSLHPQSAVRALLPNDDDLQGFIQKTRIYSEETGEELVAPIEAGDVLGEITIECDGVVYGSSLLVASSSIELNYSQFITSRIVETLKKPIVIVSLMIILLLVGIYVFLVARYRRAHKNYLKMREAGIRPEAKSKPARLPAKPENRTAKAKRTPARKPAPAPARRPVAKTPPRAAAPRANTTPDNSEFTFFDITGEQAPANTSTQTESQAERDYFEEFFGKRDK